MLHTARCPVDDWATHDLETLEARGLFRAVETLSTPTGPIIRIGDEELVQFSSNDYLGLAHSPALVARAAAAAKAWGMGAGSSRVSVGTLAPHRDLEHHLAAFEEREAALVFSSGYAANVGTISALVHANDVVFSDELNHASIIDGCRLSRATVVTYRHCDVEHLTSLVAEHRGRRRLVVTDTVFSMDGDTAPLRALAALCTREGLALMVDEAHATGVLGPNGRGLAAAEGVVPDVLLGTLSKAIGCSGAYVAGSRALIDLLANRARSLFFSTGIPPAICAAADEALSIIEREPLLREKLWSNIARFATNLGVPLPAAAIFTVQLGASQRAVAASEALRRRGFLVKPVRPPTVPAGTSRLRIVVSAHHSHAQIDALACALKETLA